MVVRHLWLLMVPFRCPSEHFGSDVVAWLMMLVVVALVAVALGLFVALVVGSVSVMVERVVVVMLEGLVRQHTQPGLAPQGVSRNEVEARAHRCALLCLHSRWLLVLFRSFLPLVAQPGGERPPLLEALEVVVEKLGFGFHEIPPLLAVLSVCLRILVGLCPGVVGLGCTRMCLSLLSAVGNLGCCLVRFAAGLVLFRRSTFGLTQEVVVTLERNPLQSPLLHSPDVPSRRSLVGFLRGMATWEHTQMSSHLPVVKSPQHSLTDTPHGVGIPQHKFLHLSDVAQCSRILVRPVVAKVVHFHNLLQRQAMVKTSLCLPKAESC